MSACPDTLELRAFAEDGENAGLAEHVRDCARCEELVALARREEAAIRAALPVDVPGDVLERSLAAVNREVAGQEPSRPRKRRRRRRVRRGRGIWIPLTAVAAAGLLLVFAQLRARSFDPGPARRDPTDRLAERPPEERPPQERPPEERPPQERPPEERPPQERPPEERPPQERPPEERPPEERPPEERPPEERPPEERPPEEPPPQAPQTSTPALALAYLSSGKLASPGLSLAQGDALPPDTSLRVGSAAATVRSDGAATLCFAPRSRFSISLHEGRRVFLLEKGAVFARTAGTLPYGVATDAGLATPLGTAFFVERKSTKTRVRTFEGLVRLAVNDVDATADVRSGFEAVAVRGKFPSPASPSSGAVPRWLPDGLRPLPAPRFEALRTFEFEGDVGGFAKGSLHQGGARGTGGCLRAAPRRDTYAVYVELEEERGVVALSPDLWIEVTCRSDRATTVVLQIWNPKAGENLSHFVELPARQWVTIAAPLRDFTDPSGKPRSNPVSLGDPGTCFNVFAGKQGEALELLVDDVRFFAERR